MSMGKVYVFDEGRLRRHRCLHVRLSKRSRRLCVSIRIILATFFDVNRNRMPGLRGSTLEWFDFHLRAHPISSKEPENR